MVTNHRSKEAHDHIKLQMIRSIRFSYLCRSGEHIWSRAPDGWATNDLLPLPKWYRIQHSVKQWQTENTEPIRFLNFSFYLFFVRSAHKHNIHSTRGGRRRISFHHFRRIISAFTHICTSIHFTAMATPSSQPCDTLQYARTHIPKYVEEKEAETEADSKVNFRSFF